MSPDRTEIDEVASNACADGDIDINALISMIDYLIPDVRKISPVSTLFLTLAQQELISILLARQNVIYRLPNGNCPD
jgi:hypothetical protein